MKERFRDLHARIRAACLSGAVSLLSGRGYRRFRDSCETVRLGESLDAVRKRLEAAGGRHWRADNIHRWQRARGITFKVGVCTVEVDDERIVQACKFEDVDDLL